MHRRPQGASATMKAILLLIAGVVLANIVWATFFWKTPAKAAKESFTPANSATVKGQEPWMVNEKYNAPGRDIARKAALESLNKPWASFCTADGHKDLLEGINYYFDRRNAQIQSYANTYGEAAKKFAIKAWTTTDDNRIERLMSETHGRGYFSLDELRPYARMLMAALVKDAKASAKPCAA
jgi:hypothetical protein